MNLTDTYPLPVFIGHGSPMNAIMNNGYSTFLHEYAQSIPKPKAIVVISAHWQTKGTRITGSASPHQIYDFYGFPKELYEIAYSPVGSPEIAQLINSQIPEIEIDTARGIDHAGWAVVKHMYPDASIPLLQISLDVHKSPEEHFQLGKRLAQMAGEQILFIGSGNIIHNLGDITFDEQATPFGWAQKADNWIKDKINSKHIADIIDYEHCFPDYRRSIPTNEHYLPLLYILGMHDGSSDIHTLYEEIQNGSISMRSIEVHTSH